jgi:hypothetical protein
VDPAEVGPHLLARCRADYDELCNQLEGANPPYECSRREFNFWAAAAKAFSLAMLVLDVVVLLSAFGMELAEGGHGHGHEHEHAHDSHHDHADPHSAAGPQYEGLPTGELEGEARGDNGGGPDEKDEESAAGHGQGDLEPEPSKHPAGRSWLGLLAVMAVAPVRMVQALLPVPMIFYRYVAIRLLRGQMGARCHAVCPWILSDGLALSL